MKSVFLRLTVTVLVVALALAGTDYVQSALGYPSFLLLLPTVIVIGAAWGGLVGSCAALVGAIGEVLLLEPRWSLDIADPSSRVLVGVFVVVALPAVWIASRQQRLREAMTRSEAEFRALFELAAVGTATVEALTGRILRVNEQFCRITGYDRRELLSMTIADVTHPDDRPRDRLLYDDLIAGRRIAWSTEKRYVRRNGDIVWVLVNGVLIRDEQGRPDHMLAHAVDITARRRAEEEAREANRLKDEFLATLSHELRTPLNVVVGWTHFLHRKVTSYPPDVQKALPVISRNVDALRVLTEDLLGMSDALAGRMQLRCSTFDLGGALADLIESVSLAAAAKGVTIERRLPSELRLHGDERRLRQVFWNLLSNALKFTPDGGIIRIAARLEGGHAVVEVSDTGIGIAPSFLPHVFEKFRQEDSSATRAYSGLGLGLAVARQFTELHGGTITAQSPGRGAGSIFTVRLPINVSLDAPDRQREYVPGGAPAGSRLT